MKWAPQSNDYQREYLVSDKFETEGILFTSGRILVKDALIQDGYVFLNGRKRINYEKRNVLIRYLDILEASVKYKLTFNTFLNFFIRILPIVLLTLCLTGIAYLSKVDSQLYSKDAENLEAIYTITLILLFVYVPYYFILHIFKDGTFKRFYDTTLHLVVSACEGEQDYVIEKKVSPIYADDIRSTLRDYINYCWRIRNGIPDNECVKLFSIYTAESTVISELGSPLGRSTSSGLVERPDGVLDI